MPASARPARVACIVSHFPVISQTFVASELIELRRRGVEVRILALHRSEEVCHRFIVRAGLPAMITYGRDRFLPALRDFEPDLLHAHFATEATAEARKLAAQLALPFTFTAHGYDIYDRAPEDFSERAAAAAAVVTVSRENARQIVRRFGVDRQRIRVIPCGVNLRRIRRTPAVRPLDEAPAIVCVARHEPVKNLTLLLEALGALRQRGTEFKAVLIGDGSCRNAIEAARRHLGLELHVEIKGASDHDGVLRWWRRASVAVLCSHREGLPVSLMEAAACGVPAVATRVGGIPELVQDGVTGVLTPAGDAPALADGLARLAGDPELRTAMGRAAHQRVEELFSVHRQVDAMLQLWSELEVP